jgi:hypothetical protein
MQDFQGDLLLDLHHLLLVNNYKKIHRVDKSSTDPPDFHREKEWKQFSMRYYDGKETFFKKPFRTIGTD